jgi:O-antigen/teichoic acid export membrane protein
VLSISTGIASQASILVTGIIAARALGVTDRGHFAFIFLVAQVLAVIAQLGVSVAIPYFIASSPGRIRHLMWTVRRLVVLQILCVTVVHAAILLILFGSSGHEVQVAAAISLCTSGIQVAQSYGLGVLQGLRRFWSFNILRLSAPGTYAVLATIAYVLDYRTLVDMTIVYSIAYVAAGLATVVRAAQFALPLDDAPLAGDPSRDEVLRFGLRGLLGSSAPIETFKIDQSIVGLFLSAASLGLYVSAVSFTNLPRFVAQSIGMVAYPSVARRPDERQRRHVMWQFNTLAIVVCTAIVVALELAVGWLVPFLYGSAFTPAVPVARVLLIAGLFTSVRRIMSDGARGIGQPGIGSIAEFCSLAFLVPCLLISVQFGLLPVAWGLTAGAAGSTVVLLYLLHRRRGAREVAPPGQPPIAAVSAEG